MSPQPKHKEGPEGGVRIPVPSIEIIQNPSPNMNKGKIASLEAVAMTKDHC